MKRLCPCAGEALGKNSLLPVPYDSILKEPGCVVAHGLPDGVGLKKPCEYDTKTLMKILEQSHRIQFSVNRRVCCPLHSWNILDPDVEAETASLFPRCELKD